MIISRRVLRIKVLQAIYSHFISKRPVHSSEKELWLSIEKTYDQFFYLIDLLIEIYKYKTHFIQVSKEKNFPTPEDLNPNTRFIENQVIHKIEENTQYKRYKQNKKISWVEYKDFIRKISLNIKEFDEYKEYMQAPQTNFNLDKKIIMSIYSCVIAESDDLYQVLEDMNIYWNAEIEYTIEIIVNCIKKMKKEHSPEKMIIDLSEKQEERDYIKHLFRKTVMNHTEYDDIIAKFTTNWDIKRIAIIDKYVLYMGITEILECPDIPVKVTFNEYIDIIKLFSTPKSKIFVNGVLDKIIKQFNDKKKIVKTGRGLIGEL
ncbi:MAG: transcription antitermination factor NusB [Bacteroidota bacterium]